MEIDSQPEKPKTYTRGIFDGKTGALSWMEVASDSVYGPQWTHPHPSFSADERRITFASDRTGTTQVYVAECNKS